MVYSITAVLHGHVDKHNLSKILIQVIYHRKKVYAPTVCRVSPANFKDQVVTGGDNKSEINSIIKHKKNDIESRLLQALGKNADLTKDELDKIVKGERSTGLLVDFIYELVEELKGKLSDGRLAHYLVIAGKIEKYAKSVKVSQINVAWMEGFEMWLRRQGLDGNTVQSKMSLMKGILNRAHGKGLVTKDQFELYKVPLYVQKLPDFLTEAEVKAFWAIVDAMPDSQRKLAGYYFLLGCQTGYRISNMKIFDIEKDVKDDIITIMAVKNKSVVSIQIHSNLQRVLDYIKDKPFSMAEQTMRDYVKEIAMLAGIGRKIKVHSARHTFAMMLMQKGFTIDEVSHLIGDTKIVTKVYARIHNESLNKKILERLG